MTEHDIMTRAHGGAERRQCRISLVYNFREPEFALPWTAFKTALNAARNIMRGHCKDALIAGGNFVDELEYAVVFLRHLKSIMGASGLFLVADLCLALNTSPTSAARRMTATPVDELHPMG